MRILTFFSEFVDLHPLNSLNLESLGWLFYAIQNADIPIPMVGKSDSLKSAPSAITQKKSSQPLSSSKKSSAKRSKENTADQKKPRRKSKGDKSDSSGSDNILVFEFPPLVSDQPKKGKNHAEGMLKKETSTRSGKSTSYSHLAPEIAQSDPNLNKAVSRRRANSFNSAGITPAPNSVFATAPTTANSTDKNDFIPAINFQPPTPKQPRISDQEIDHKESEINLKLGGYIENYRRRGPRSYSTPNLVKPVATKAAKLMV
jgi:hypothetical protein